MKKTKETAAPALPNHRTPAEIIEAEIIDEILCKLPVKSLARFRCVSRSWNSKISESSFIRKHLAAAALSRKRLVIVNDYFEADRVQIAFSCPLSSILSDDPLKDATINCICPLQYGPFSNVIFRASCNELWCVEVNNSMFLWNPSTRTNREITPPPPANCNYCNIYGMGYDSVGDDYKLLKIPCFHEAFIQGEKRTHSHVETVSYSLRSNAWRVHPFPGKSKPYSNGKLVNGALHWILYSGGYYISASIVSFDLLTEKYGEVAQPEYSPMLEVGDVVDITVLNGMLCAYVNYRYNAHLIFWVMKDYGDEKSWTKINEIDYYNNISPIIPIEQPSHKNLVEPLYLFDDGGVLILARNYNELLILLYKDQQSTSTEPIVVCRCDIFFSDAFIYVESLISPTDPTFQQKPMQEDG